MSTGPGMMGGAFYGKGGGGEPPRTTTEGPKRDDLRLQYETLVGLFKHYVELVLKFNLAFYAITGALLSYYLAHVEVRVVRFALLLPVVFAVMFSLFFIYGIILREYWRNDLFWIRDQLRLNTTLETRVLSALLGITTFLFLLVAGALLLVVCRPDIITTPAGTGL